MVVEVREARYCADVLGMPAGFSQIPRRLDQHHTRQALFLEAGLALGAASHLSDPVSLTEAPGDAQRHGLADVPANLVAFLDRPRGSRSLEEMFGVGSGVATA